MAQVSPGGSRPGQPAFDANGTINPDLSRRADHLWLYASNTTETSAFVDSLAHHGAFEKWPLRLNFDEGYVEIADLFRISRQFLQSPGYLEWLNSAGPSSGAAIQYHHLSLPLIAELASLAGRAGP